MASNPTQDKASTAPELAQPWKPKAGDSLTGHIINLDLMDSKFKDVRQVFLITIRDAEGKLWTFSPPSNAER